MEIYWIRRAKATMHLKAGYNSNGIDHCNRRVPARNGTVNRNGTLN